VSGQLNAVWSPNYFCGNQGPWPQLLSMYLHSPPPSAFLLPLFTKPFYRRDRRQAAISLPMPLFYQTLGCRRAANTISVSCYRLYGTQRRSECAAFNVMPFRGDSDLRRNDVIDWTLHGKCLLLLLTSSTSFYAVTATIIQRFCSRLALTRKLSAIGSGMYVSDRFFYFVCQLGLPLIPNLLWLWRVCYQETTVQSLTWVDFQ